MIIAGVLLAITLAYISIYMSAGNYTRIQNSPNVSMPNIEFSTENSPAVYRLNISDNNFSAEYTVLLTTDSIINSYCINNDTQIPQYGPAFVVNTKIYIYPLLYVYPQQIVINNSNRNIEFNIMSDSLKEIFIGYNSSLYEISFIHEYLSGNNTLIQVGLHLKDISRQSEIVIPIWTEYNMKYYYTYIIIIY
uniref:Uncharacterized protein n=2 Tax=Acidianus brierleyi TaxID=41673 RepID=A0A2U9IF16_9CREN